MNKYWPAIPLGRRWRDRMRLAAPAGYFCETTWNSKDQRSSLSTKQAGGCSTSVFGKVAHGARAAGHDPTGLGRFSWVRIEGRVKAREPPAEGEDVRSRTQDLIVVTAYRPCRPTKGSSTVWAQHRIHLTSIGRNEDPREAFVTDLLAAVSEWRSWGCEVILGVDANEDLTRSGPQSFRRRLLEAGLEEVVLSCHRGTPPATQIDNLNAEPIDGLFATSGVVVKASGYLEFYEHFSSDHRGLWMDIDLFETLGGHQPKPLRPIRQLNTKNRHVRRRYVRLAEAGYKRYNIRDRLRTIHNSLAELNWQATPALEHQYNSLHAQARTIRAQAEKRCRKVRRGGKEWSPQSQDIRDLRDLWKLLLDRHQGKRVSSRKLWRLLAKTGETEAYKFPASEVVQRLAADRARLKEAQEANLRKWRSSHIDASQRRAEAAERKKKTRFNRERFSALQSMHKREETRRRQRALGKGSNGGLRLIHVERRTAIGGVEEVTCSAQADVEAGCMQENLERYDQTRFPHPTPPMKPPLYQEFTGPMAQDHIDDLLAGCWEGPSTLDPATSAFLGQCRSQVGPRSMMVTPTSNRSFWRRNPETKGSEPTGLHNGHYKAATFSDHLNECDTLFRDIPMRSGLAPDAWKNIMNFAIEKKPGEFRVKKMRTIQMMDAEYQASNKQVGKDAMAFAEANDLIPKGQCGARKKHQAIDLAVSKRLVWDQLFMEHRPAGWILNDAKSCFDRVVHWVAQVALRRFGMPWEVVDFMFSTLRVAKYHVRTGFGDLTTVFSLPSAKPFQGCGQGNGCVLIDTIEARGFGCEFLTALDAQLRAAECFCFMDDTDLVQAASDPSVPALAILRSVQKALSLWSGSVLATGGAINPEKSFWWLIDYVWCPSKGSWRYKRVRDLSGSVQIPDLMGRPYTLQRLEPDQTERTLGVQMSPQFNGAAQLKVLKEKASSWATQITSGTLMPYDVLPLVKTTILKSLQYPMALTHFSAKVWERIMSPVLRAALPKARICRNFPRAVVYGPQRFQGLGIPHPSGLQLYCQLDFLLRHPANRTSSARYLDLCLQSHQLETGTSYSLFQQVYDNTAILASNTWPKRVWKDMEEAGFHVELNTPPPELQREGDQLLVEIFTAAEVDQETLLWLNWCRKYLHAETLADIVDASGTHILESAWNGKLSFHKQDRYIWARNPPRITQRHWTAWRETLSSLLVDP